MLNSYEKNFEDIKSNLKKDLKELNYLNVIVQLMELQKLIGRERGIYKLQILSFIVLVVKSKEYEELLNHKHSLSDQKEKAINRFYYNEKTFIHTTNIDTDKYICVLTDELKDIQGIIDKIQRIVVLGGS